MTPRQGPRRRSRRPDGGGSAGVRGSQGTGAGRRPARSRRHREGTGCGPDRCQRGRFATGAECSSASAGTYAWPATRRPVAGGWRSATTTSTRSPTRLDRHHRVGRRGDVGDRCPHLAARGPDRAPHRRPPHRRRPRNVLADRQRRRRDLRRREHRGDGRDRAGRTTHRRGSSRPRLPARLVAIDGTSPPSRVVGRDGAGLRGAGLRWARPVVRQPRHRSGVALLLTATMVLGAIHTDRVTSTRWPRFTVHAVHRNLSLLTLAFLAVHIGTGGRRLLRGHRVARRRGAVRVGLPPVLARAGRGRAGPGARGAGHEPVRTRIGCGVAGVHCSAYALWPVALLHGIGIGGNDTQLGVGSAVNGSTWPVASPCGGDSRIAAGRTRSRRRSGAEHGPGPGRKQVRDDVVTGSMVAAAVLASGPISTIGGRRAAGRARGRPAARRLDRRRARRHLREHATRYGRLPIVGTGGGVGRHLLIDSVRRAGLRGRGGAGFPTADKLAAVAARRARPSSSRTAAKATPPVPRTTHCCSWPRTSCSTGSRWPPTPSAPTTPSCACTAAAPGAGDPCAPRSPSAAIPSA